MKSLARQRRRKEVVMIVIGAEALGVSFGESVLFQTVLIEDSTACLCSDVICLPIKCPQVCSYTRAGFS